MARGRKGQSAEECAARGNPGKRGAKTSKAETGESPLPPVSETTPAYLSAEAKKVWARVAPLLAPMNFFRATDHEALARYCENLKNWWACERHLRREKWVFTTKSKHGELDRINRYFVIQDRLERRLVVLEDRLGLNTRARQEIIRGLAAGPGELPMPNPEEAGKSGELPGPLGMLSPGAHVH